MTRAVLVGLVLTASPLLAVSSLWQRWQRVHGAVGNTVVDSVGSRRNNGRLQRVIHARCRARPAWSRRIRPGPSASAVDRKSTRLNSSHVAISYAVFCLKKKTA